MADPPFTCGLSAALAVVGGKWKPLIIYFLLQETRRYGALKRAVAEVSDKMLIQQLKELADDGIVIRNDYGEIPPRVEYSLTPFGVSLAQALAMLCAWGEQHAERVGKIIAARERSSAKRESVR
jgi:DNA-binding HxlR family transcriptional regulator